MATKSLIDEYRNMGGDRDVSALSDDEVLDLLEELSYEQKKPSYTQDLFTDDGTKATYEQATGRPWVGTGEAVSAQPSYDIPPVEVDARTLSDEALMTMLKGGELPATPENIDEATYRMMTKDRNFIENITDPVTRGWTADRIVKQTQSGALNTLDLLQTVSAIGGLGVMGVEALGNVVAPPEQDLNGLITGDVVEGHKFGSDQMFEFARNRNKGVKGFVGTGEARNVEESIAELAGSMIPVPGSGKLKGAANLLEYVTPFVVGGNYAPRLAVNFATGFVGEQSIREVVDNEESDYVTTYDAMGISEDDADAMGIALAASAVTLPFWAPHVVAGLTKAKQGVQPTVKAITDMDRLGPEDLYSISNTGDVMKAHIVDDKQVLIDKADQAGVPNIDQVRTMIDTDTAGSADIKVGEALVSGKMRSAFGDFISPVSPKMLQDALGNLPAPVQGDWNRYLLLGDYADTIRARAAQGISKTGDGAELFQIEQTRLSMRNMYPNLAEWSKGVQQYTESVRNFTATGKYAIVDMMTKQALDKGHSHYVPMALDDIDPNDIWIKRVIDGSSDNDRPTWQQPTKIDEIDMSTQDKRKAAIPELMDYGQTMLRAQLANNSKGVWIDNMLQSKYNLNGEPLIRKVKGDEATKFPERVVRLYRNGKEEKYLTDSLYANLLKFDPYVVNGLIPQTLYAQRRAFEHGTTGVPSVTFGLTTGIRDTIAGWVNAEKGVRGPGIDVLTAPVSILNAKATKAFYTAIKARLAAGQEAWFLPWMDAHAQEQLAGRLASTYQKTAYHLAKEEGGFDGSIMKERIKVGRNLLAQAWDQSPEIVQQYGRMAKPMFAGLSAIFDSMQEAPRYSAFVRNIEDGMPPRQAARLARNLTGDTMRSGRVLDSKGKVITGDVTDPVLGGLLLPLEGALTETARLSIPYINPAIQGMRRAAAAATADPTRFALRNWVAVGMPAIVGYSWNQMLGAEYPRYAYEGRDERSQVMEMYFGIPGLPPERGLSIPIAHESAPFMSPFQTFLYHMGDSGPEQMEALRRTGMSILGNVTGVGIPPTVSMMYNMSGYDAPDSALALGQGTYPIREDNMGLLPSNVEAAVRSMFGSMGDTGVDVLNGFAGGGVDAAIDELANSIAGRSPILKGIGGWRANTGTFSSISAEKKKKLEAYNTFDKYWSAWFGSYGVQGDEQPSFSMSFDDPNKDQVAHLDFPYGKVGPEPLTRPLNPLYQMYGQKIRDAIKTNDYGFVESTEQAEVLTDQIQLLRGWNAGKKKAFEAWQDELDNADERLILAKEAQAKTQEVYDAVPRGQKTGSPEKRLNDRALDEVSRAQWMLETSEFLKTHKVDLGNRFDVIRFTNLLEQRRVDLMKHQIQVIETIEDDLTAEFQAQGLLPPGRKFSIEEMLDPMTNPVKQPAQPLPVQ